MPASSSLSATKGEKKKRETGADGVPFLKIIYTLKKNAMHNVLTPLNPINIEAKLTHGLEFFGDSHQHQIACSTEVYSDTNSENPR